MPFGPCLTIPRTHVTFYYAHRYANSSKLSLFFLQCQVKNTVSVAEEGSVLSGQVTMREREREVRVKETGKELEKRIFQMITIYNNSLW